MARPDDAMADGREDMRPRRVKVSTQMQVRIPAAFYQRYGFGTEELCVPTETGVEFRPVLSPVDQSADILQTLLDENYPKGQIVDEFRRRASERLSRVVNPDEMDVEEERVDVRTKRD